MRSGTENVAGINALAMAAEIFSDQFRVYSSKDFPGMRASSALTWNLRKMGMTELKPRDGKGKGVAKEKRRSEDYR